MSRIKQTQPRPQRDGYACMYIGYIFTRDEEGVHISMDNYQPPVVISRTAFGDQESMAKESIWVTEFNSEIRFDVIGLLFRLQ